MGDNRLRTRAMVMVTHDVEEAVLMSDRVLILDATSKRIDDEFSVNIPRAARNRESLRHLTDRIRSCLYKNRASAIGRLTALFSSTWGTEMNHKSVLMTLLILLPAAASGAEIVNKDGNKLDLYGQLNGVHYFSSDADNNGDRSYTRFGFKGETQIGDALTGYGQWEYQAGLDQPESAGPGDSYTRLGFAGLAFGPWGSLDYGRNYGLLYDVAGWTDVLPEFGNDSYEAADNFMTGRANGLLTYHNRSLGGLVDGLDLGLQYQGKNRGRRSTGEGYPDAKRRWLRLFRHLRHRRGAQRWRRLRQLCAHAGATALRPG